MGQTKSCVGHFSSVALCKKKALPTFLLGQSLHFQSCQCWQHMASRTIGYRLLLHRNLMTCSENEAACSHSKRFQVYYTTDTVILRRACWLSLSAPCCNHQDEPRKK